MRFRIYGEKNVFKTCSNDEIPYQTPFARPQLEYIKNISKIKNPINQIKLINHMTTLIKKIQKKTSLNRF